MKISRRDYIRGAFGVTFLPLALPVDSGAPRRLSMNNSNSTESHAQAEEMSSFDPSSPLPHKSAFYPIRGSYLNSASQHPMSVGARKSINEYLEYKTFSKETNYSMNEIKAQVIDSFASLINASPEEIYFVQSTTAGENLIIDALGIPEVGGRIVTDTLHFPGSFPTYAELSKQGMEVITLRHKNGRIDIDQFENSITTKTKLVAISSVSRFNGFEHDLRRICEIAHAKGALVYADIIQSVGCVPLDVRKTGVDFCSTASYKWLMGDMGLGFVFIRSDRLQRLKRPWYGYNQLTSFDNYVNPIQPAKQKIAEYSLGQSTRGYFAMGTEANAVAAALVDSLQYILQVGVKRIQSYRQPMMELLHQEIPRLGYKALTPVNSTTPIVSFACTDGLNTLRPALKEAGVTVAVYDNYFRVSPSVFNDINDIERLLEALA